MSGFVFSEKPIQIERGEGVFVFDSSNEKYLDLGASYACVPVGHSHPGVVFEVTDQLSDLTYVQGSYPVSSRTALYERLGEVAPGSIGKVWLCNSGTEANEAAIKFARHATGRTKIVSTMMGFHGRTYGSLSATWKDEYREGYEPLVDGFEFVPYGDSEAIVDAVDDETAAVIVEPIQGEGGINAPSDEYLAAIRECTTDAGAAMIVDEIQTGLGRTGEFWAVDHADVVPDIVTVAKGIANGLPLGATLCRDWIASDAGNHGGTFSGGPLVSRAALATLDVIESEELVTNAQQTGAYLIDSINAAVGDSVRDVRGLGLMIGIQVPRGANSMLRELAISHNILALPAGRTVVRLLPPLILDETHVDQFVTAFEAVVNGSSDA